MATRGSGVSKAGWDEVCKAAHSGKSLKSWQRMLMTNEKSQKVEHEASGADDEKHG